jgi:predicted nucleic-acid-binding protein
MLIPTRREPRFPGGSRTSGDIFIPDTVILESEWVLRYAYDFKPADISRGFRKLFGMKNVHATHLETVAQALVWHENGLDFADAFHLALSQHHSKLKTFDGKFIKRASNLSYYAK